MPIASIVSIDTSAARAHPGVLAVLTGDDYVADGHLGMAHFPNPADAIDVSIPTFAPMAERKILDELQLPLATGRVRYVGEAVAIVVAESLVAARDAAEKVVVEYEILPGGQRCCGSAVTRGADDLAGCTQQSCARQRVRRSAPPSRPRSRAPTSSSSRPSATSAPPSAFMEPRSAIGRYDEAEGQYILISGCQGVHRVRHPLAGCLKVPQERVRVICPDVGGGFGSRTNLYPEQVAVVWAARRVGRAVKWTGDRHEAFLTDYTARDVVTQRAARLRPQGPHAARARPELTANIGAHTRLHMFR